MVQHKDDGLQHTVDEVSCKTTATDCGCPPVQIGLMLDVALRLFGAPSKTGYVRSSSTMRTLSRPSTCTRLVLQTGNMESVYQHASSLLPDTITCSPLFQQHTYRISRWKFWKNLLAPPLTKPKKYSEFGYVMPAVLAPRSLAARGAWPFSLFWRFALVADIVVAFYLSCFPAPRQDQSTMSDRLCR